LYRKIRLDKQVMREKPSIPEEHLRACLQEQYDLIPDTLDVLPLGLDTRAFVCRVVSEHGTSYLLKARSGTFYEPSCLIPDYLRDRGIAAVVAPLLTKKNTLWTNIGDWTVIVYPFLEGDTSWTGMTDEHWKELGTIFKRIHQVMVPTLGFESLRKETFDPMGYARWVRAFETSLAVAETQHAHSEGGRVSKRTLRASWMEHQSTIHQVVTVLEKLAEILQRQSAPHVICHADLHPANLIRDHVGHVFVIDWDEVMLAPRERDFLFVKEASTDGSSRQGIPPFFQGYGQTEIDWTALTYYRYERVVQDLIECTQEVFFRDDLGEKTKADAIQLFRDILAEGGEVDAARAAAAHLTSDLNFHNQEERTG